MERAYAQALYEAVQGGMKPQQAVAALRKALEKDGRSALLPKVARAFARLADSEARHTRLTLSVARESDMRAAAAEAGKLIGQNNEFDACVDDSLVGGWRLEGRGMLVDASWKKDLLSIYNRATK